MINKERVQVTAILMIAFAITVTCTRFYQLSEDYWSSQDNFLSPTEKLRQLEEKDLNHQVQTEQLEERQFAEVQARLSRLELERRLEEGTASQDELVAAQSERRALLDYQSGINGPDGLYKELND